MKLNQKTINHIKESEGLRLKAYPDPGSSNGLPVTIGYGTTKIGGKPVKLGTTITQAQAEQYLTADLEAFAAKVARLIQVSLSDDQFGALVSFAYNVGIGAFASSTLLRLLNAGDYNAVPAQLRRWNQNDGKVMQGLVNRREKEINLWSGKGTSIPATAEPTDGPKPSTGGSPSPTKSKGLLELLIELLLKLFGKR